MNYALIGAAAEREVGVAERFHIRAIDQGINVWKNLTETWVSENFLIGESCVAPYVLACLLLDSARQFGKGFHLIKRVTTGECDIGKLICLNHLQQFIDGNLLATIEIP